MPSVYIETTIPSFYCETRDEQQILAWRNVTREWWDCYRSRYDLFTSRFVLQELADAPQPKSRDLLALIADVQVLDEPAELPDVIEYYLEHRLMPGDAFGDAAHLAMASLHSMEFLLTWNCRHLANSNKARHIGILNARMGLATPVITTPLTLMPEESGQ